MSTNPHNISLQEAEMLTHSYQNSAQFTNQTISASIDVNSITQLINQVGCIGVRFYFSLNTANKLTLVIVGTDNDNNDILTEIILNKMDLCPPTCVNSPLIK